MSSRFALVAALFIFTVPSDGQAACAGPDGATVLSEPLADGPVLGGVAAGQCGFELTAECQAGYCFGFFEGLSGYVAQASLTGDSAVPLAAFSYRPVRADGTLEMMGRTAPFEITDDTPLEIVPSPAEAILRMPAPWSVEIPLQKTGSSTWDGQIADWMGVPVPVAFELDQLGARQARLRLIADHQMLRMDVILHLERVGAPAVEAVSSKAGSCAMVDARAEAILASGDEVAADALLEAAADIGVTDWDAKTEEECARLAAVLAAGEGRANTAPVSRTICEDLAADLRPILRDAAHPQHRAALGAMATAGLTSLSGAELGACQALASDLAGTGVLGP